MTGLTFENAALIIPGHGSTLNGDSSAPVHQHAAAIRERRLFRQVLPCFWKEEPYAWSVLRGVFSPRVFVAPLFISEGYFTEEVLPREFGFAPRAGPAFPRQEDRGDFRLFYCGPAGTHDSMTGAILSRARRVVEENPFPRAPKPMECALFIAGHGTGSNENSRAAIERQAELIRAQGIYQEVHAIFMEETPRVEECYEMTSARYLVIVPFFISDGLHSFEDIPVLLGASPKVVRARLASGQPTWRNPTERKGKLVWYSRSVGDEPGLADVILERVREAAASGSLPRP